MKRHAKTLGFISGAVTATVVLVSLVIPGCFHQNQDNSPISINNSQGRLALNVTCSTDGSVAYVTDGRNVYRYDHGAAAGPESWECILSQGQRLELAAQYDPREQRVAEAAREKAAEQKTDERKPSDANDAVTKQ